MAILRPYQSHSSYRSYSSHHRFVALAVGIMNPRVMIVVVGLSAIIAGVASF